MYRTLVLSILLSFVTFQSGFTYSNVTGQLEGGHTTLGIPPEPLSSSFTTQFPTSVPTTPTTTLAPAPTTNPTPVPTTNSTPPAPTTNSTPAPTITPAPTSTPKPTNSTTVSPSTTSPPPKSTTVSPSTTSAPHPPPSDRKFDAFSFLGGFSLGLGLVAIGFLSWKFYLSRQENYYHTL